MSKLSSDAFDLQRDSYVKRLRPIFLPNDPTGNDIVRYFASLLRVVGMEDGGWDPHAESRGTLEDLNSFFKIDLPPERFKEPGKTTWRIGLLLYSHIVEMDAPYEVIANLLRFQLGHGYHPNPFLAFLEDKERKNASRRSISNTRKIEIIKQLSADLKLDIGDIFDDFYDNRLRNAIAHSDYVLAEEAFRCRGDVSGARAFEIPYEELDHTLLCAKALVAAFFQLELEARRIWGAQKQKAIPYDEPYKGMMEVLVNDEGLMCGFRVHWPNNTQSTYRRTEHGIDMTNCMLDLPNATIQFMVGHYARRPGPFSPLVEAGQQPAYTNLEGIDTPIAWPQQVRRRGD